MSDTQPQWQSHLYAILPHSSAPCILMVQETTGWSLPSISLDEYIWLPNWNRINEVWRGALGQDITALRYLNYKIEESEHQIYAIFVLENHTAEDVLGKGEWIEYNKLADLSLAIPEQRSIIEGYLTEIEGGTIPDLRPPWQRPGWFDSATKWIEQQVFERDQTLTAPIEYIKNWGISCVLRARTTSGDLYFKEASTLPLFADEPPLTRSLAELFPDHMPQVIGIEQQRHWMLLQDFGSTVSELDDATAQDEVFVLYPQLQMQSAEHIDELIAIGCLDRRLDKLAAQIDPLLADEDALADLEPTEIDQARQCAPQLKEMCNTLASYNVPQTLAHGDLHLGNVALKDGKYLFFDWTDSCITHPFIDMISIFFREEEEEKKTHFRDIYLSQWTRYEAMEGLLQAWALAEPLSALHQVISYQYILAALEPTARHELAGGMTHFFRQMLRALK